MHTLVVDSHPTARLILQQMLQSWRFQVATAPFADHGLYKLRRADRRAPHELLLLDWKTAGLDFVHQARETAADSGTPLMVVAMTTLQEREQATEALRELPATAVLQKPVTPSRLFDTIVRLQHGDAVQPRPASGRIGDLAEAMRPIHGARVLVAEDNLVNQQVAIAFLTMAGLDVTVANNGLEAVEWVKKARFDVVLMDMQMPEMDGLQATRAIRKLPQGDGLPLIAMTAAAMAEDQQECLAAGMNAHIAKPIDPKQLTRTLLAWVSPQAGASGTAASGAD
jgi:CheY-like chemotaxis protein